MPAVHILPVILLFLDREGVVHLPVEGDATLEEAVLIVARHHLRISPLTLNLFGFRQVQ
jgi:hypothetical protein